MKKNDINPGKQFFVLALLLLLAGLAGGVFASLIYIYPEFLKETLGFVRLRPLHVSSVMFWIITGAVACVYSGMFYLRNGTDKRTVMLARIQLVLWLVALMGIYYSYATATFGGREYWEFHPVWALPIVGSWILFLINFVRMARTIGKWPIYVWMWFTGIVFFLFIFLENYLWVFPYFRQHFVTDMIIQWKVNGSLVGAINQMLYGTSFFLMSRLIPFDNKNPGSEKLLFAMYFLGLTNLMFNWGHHIYTLPTGGTLRYVSYAVSMTEWILFIRIIRNWKKQVLEAVEHFNTLPYRFILASEFWVFVNLGQALLMSIPAINIYTHGTQVTVAHAMTTTIGINSMILLAALFAFSGNKQESMSVNRAFWTLQFGLGLLFVSLNASGIVRGIWQMSERQSTFSEMIKSQQLWIILFVVAGMIITGSFVVLIRHGLKRLKTTT